MKVCCAKEYTCALQEAIAIVEGVAKAGTPTSVAAKYLKDLLEGFTKEQEEARRITLSLMGK